MPRFGHLLRGQRQLHRLEAPGLRHRRLGAVEDVGDQLAAIGPVDCGAVDALDALLVDEDQVVPAWLSGHIDVFPELDVALGTEDREASVAPDAKALRREPVDPDIAGRPRRTDVEVADVLKARILGVGAVGDGRRDDLGVERVGEEQELLDLVAADVAEDAAVLLALEEVGRALVVVERVRPEADGVDDLADGAGLHQFAGLHRRAGLEMLRVADRKDAPGLRLHALDLVELREGGHPRLVAHHVLAVTHGGDGDLGALGGIAEVTTRWIVGVLEDLAAVLHALCIRNRAAKGPATSSSSLHHATNVAPSRVRLLIWPSMWLWVMPIAAIRMVMKGRHTWKERIAGTGVIASFRSSRCPR